MLIILLGTATARVQESEGHFLVSGRSQQVFSASSVEILGPSRMMSSVEDGMWLETESQVELLEC